MFLFVHYMLKRCDIKEHCQIEPGKHSHQSTGSDIVDIHTKN